MMQLCLASLRGRKVEYQLCWGKGGMSPLPRDRSHRAIDPIRHTICRSGEVGGRLLVRLLYSTLHTHTRLTALFPGLPG